MLTHAPPGIACSAGIRFQIGSKLDAAFEDLGEKTLRNIVRPLHVFPQGAPRRPPQEASPPSQRCIVTGRPSLAVLPFTNMSGDPQQDYFSDGITEDLITDLSNVSELVLSRNAVFRHKRKACRHGADRGRSGGQLSPAWQCPQGGRQGAGYGAADGVAPAAARSGRTATTAI